MPGMLFSSIPSVTQQNIVVSLPVFMKFSQIDKIEDIPMQSFKLKDQPENDKGVYDKLNTFI